MSLIKKIKSLISDGDQKKVEELVISTGNDKLVEEVSKVLHVPDGTTLVDGLLSAIKSTSREGLSARIKIFECVFEFVRVESGGGGRSGTVNHHVLGALVGVLLRQLDHFPTHALLPFVDQFLEHVKIKEPLQGRWMDLLPKLVCTLSERNDITVGNRQMTGDDYRYQTLRSLCDYDWPAETATALLLAVKEMNLEKEELSDIVDKVERVLRTVDYQSVPPIVYHLVLVAQSQLPGRALKAVIAYFNQQESKLAAEEDKKGGEARVEEARRNGSHSQHDTMDDIGSAEQDEEAAGKERQKRDLREAQGTVILHLTHLAQFDPSVAKDYIKLLKASTWLPHVLCSPFNLPLSLSLASIDRYQDQVLEAVRSCVLHCLLQQQRSRQCAWLRKTWQRRTDLHTVIRNTINNCQVGWDQVSSSLCHVLLALLEGGTGVRAEAAGLAVTALPVLLTRHPRLAQHCIKHISNCTLTAPNTHHYIEVLCRVARSSPLLLLEHHALVREAVVEQLQHLPPATASHLLTAASAAIKMDVPLRDALVIALRKMLFSRSVEGRVVGVRGLLLLLRHLRVQGALPSSQASLSFSSALSQISCTAQVHIETPNSWNQSLSYELLGILRRCFSQQHQVRSALYDGLYDVCRTNPKLCSNILSLLHQHLSGFLDLRPDTLNPVVLKKVAQVQGDAATLVEPLGNLLSCIAACKVYYERKRHEAENNSRMDDDEDEEEEENAVTVLNDVCVVFDVLSDKLSSCDLDDLEFDNRMEFGASPAGQKNTYFAQVMVAVYDAVLEHTFYVPGQKVEDKMRKCVALFKMQRKVVDLVKTKSVKVPAKKGEGSKSKGRPASKGPVNFNCILRLSVLADLLSTALGEEEDVPEEASKVLRDCYDLQIYLLTAVEAIVGAHKSLLPSERDRQVPYFRKIARVLFVECFENFGRVDPDDDREVTRLRLCINLINSLFVCFSTFHKDKLEQILKEVTNKTASKDLDGLSYAVFKGCQKMLIRILNHENRDPQLKDATVIVQVMAQVSQFMTPDSDEITRAYEWIVQLCKDQTVSHSQFCEEVLKLLLCLTDQLKANHNYYHLIAHDIYQCLGDNDQNVSMPDAAVEHSIVSEDTVSSAISVLMARIDDTVTLVEMSIQKQRAFLLTATNHDTADKVEEYINVKLGMIIKAINEIIRSALPLGPIMDMVIKRADKLYGVLALFVRYYLDLFRIKNYPQISEKFEKLVHMSGELLSDPLYLFLNYMEDARSNGKGVALQTALKESKMIPSLVFAIEKYEKLVIQLSKKSKVNLMTGMKLSTLRDFKIETTKLAQRLEVGDEEEGNGEEEAAPTAQQGGKRKRSAEEEVEAAVSQKVKRKRKTKK